MAQSTPNKVFSMSKYAIDDVSVTKIGPNSPFLNYSIPQLAYHQGVAHDTRLPYEEHVLPRVAENFKNVIGTGDVDAYAIHYKNSHCVGALFLSPLLIGKEKGRQMDDVVVHPDFRRLGLGTHLIHLGAAIVKNDGYRFLGWECEEGNPAQELYQSLGATLRDDVAPFRLPKKSLDKAMKDYNPAYNIEQTEASAALRFSLFRTATNRIAGYTVPSNQRYRGIQIESLDFNTIEEGRQLVMTIVDMYRQHGPVDFADLVVPKGSDKHIALITSFDAKQNTYSGNPAMLWKLEGPPLDDAATKGRQIKFVA